MKTFFLKSRMIIRIACDKRTGEGKRERTEDSSLCSESQVAASIWTMDTPLILAAGVKDRRLKCFAVVSGLRNNDINF